MVFVNINIPDEVHKTAKSKAASEGLKLKEYIIQGIEEKNKRGE